MYSSFWFCFIVVGILHKTTEDYGIVQSSSNIYNQNLCLSISPPSWWQHLIHVFPTYSPLDQQTPCWSVCHILSRKWSGRVVRVVWWVWCRLKERDYSRWQVSQHSWQLLHNFPGSTELDNGSMGTNYEVEIVFQAQAASGWHSLSKAYFSWNF